MDKVKFNDDVNLLSEFLNCKLKNKNESNITPFSNIDRIYKWTNEEFELYPKDNLEGKKVLTITASADHALDAVLKGATEIDSIDINVFCKYYSALKIAMIKTYDYMDFYAILKRFTNDDIGLSRMLILDEISKFLTREEIEFWTEYISFKEKNYRNLFVFQLSGSKFNSYNCKEKYNDLKERLHGVTINYYDGDMVNINDILKNKTYDCMYLSNLIERIDNEFRDEKRRELILKLEKHLNHNGLIYNYSLGINDYFFDWISLDFENEYNFEYLTSDDLEFEKQNSSMLIMKKK